MNNAFLFMQILQSLGNLGDNVPREMFAKVGEANDLMEELSTRGQLKNDVIILPRFRKVYEFDDVGMIQLSHDLNFFQDV
jgi:hypothetical protein